jgi:hypothetical protein
MMMHKRKRTNNSTKGDFSGPLQDFCLPESFSLSSVFCPAEAAVSISEPSLDLGFWGRSNTRRGDGRSGPGALTTGGRGQGLGRAPWW